MQRFKRCYDKQCCRRRSWARCCGGHEEETDMREVLASSHFHPSEDAITQLLADIEQTVKSGRVAEKVVSGVQISKDIVSALGTLPWVGAALTIIALGLNMTLKTHDNREQCIGVMKESLDIWQKVMKPVLETKGSASELMGESIGLIIESYVYCKNLLNSKTWKRFVCASNYEKELDTWKKKQVAFLAKASAVMTVDIIRNVFPIPPPPPQTSATTLVGLEEPKRRVIKLLELEDKEKIRVVVLHGMGGVGKSTLAENVYKQASILRDRRHCRIDLGEKPTKKHIKSLQRQMVENLTGKSLNKMERDSEGITADKWRQVLLNERGDPIFIYIDNVLQSNDLEQLLSLDSELIKLSIGSRLLITTRDISICTRIFERNPRFEVKEFQVEPLNDRDAEKLFLLHAFGQEEPSAELVHLYNDDQGLIKKMASSICGNLPLALRMLGRSLFNKSVPLWRKKYNNLKSDRNLLVDRILKLSYDTLECETQTAFLMACVCFYDFEYHNFKNIIESVLPKATITRLFELSLLEKHVSGVEEKYVAAFIKIHDLVKNLGYQMAVERNYAPTNVLTCKEDFQDLHDEQGWSKIKWLRVPPLEDGIEAEFLEKCKELEVLCLETHVTGHVKSPPQSLKVVSSKSRLSFNFNEAKELVCWIGEPTSIDEEFPVPRSTRGIRVFYLFGGPNISENAINCHKNTLRIIGCAKLLKLSPCFCMKMTSLRELILKDFEGECLPEEVGSLTSLEVLIVSSTTIRELPRSLALLKRLQTLSLVLKNMKEIPSGMLQGMKELTWLHLLCERITCMPMEDLCHLALLEALDLELPCVKRFNADDDGVYIIKLEKLRFFKMVCDRVRSLESVQFSCPSLECLMLCLKSIEVLPPYFITKVTNLQSVFLRGCKSLQELSTETEMMHGVVSLAIMDCTALKAIPEGFMKGVERLVVTGCTGLEKLPANVVDKEKAESMRFLACDTHLLPPHLLELSTVVPLTVGVWRAEQQLDSFVFETFYPTSILAK